MAAAEHRLPFLQASWQLLVWETRKNCQNVVELRSVDYWAEVFSKHISYYSRFVAINAHEGLPGRCRFGLGFGFFTKTVQEQVELLQLFIGDSNYRQLVPTTIPTPLNRELYVAGGADQHHAYLLLLRLTWSNVLATFRVVLEDRLRFFSIGRCQLLVASLDILHLHGFVSLTKDIFCQTCKLRIGYFDDDGFCPPVPGNEGHEVIRFTVPNVVEMVQILFKLLMPDNGHYIRSLYNNDVIDQYMKVFVMLLKVPNSLRWLASFILKPISPQLSALCSAYISNLHDLRYTNERCDDYKNEFIAYWQRLNIDALICPSFPVPAVPHRFPSKISLAATYTALFNMLDFPAGVVPIGKVTVKDDEDVINESSYPVGYNIALRMIRDASSKSAGLPLSVQVVTLPFQEEKCLYLMKEVEKIWNNDHLEESTLSNMKT
ncbi:hypothetical protein DICVIV_01590 [Dictyocaulus viviparus]|uniref:Amidase domain-containing protein n=1 Tax=Dictyocaulus viviparus TaxID=29172 RepID=A0A0D8Y7V4_DICVI|nr:hypothetical protein DICVIV_01590 [Dictyocaulus viviparus]